MKVQIVKSNGKRYFYLSKSVRFGDEVKNKIIKRLGSEQEICEKYGVADAKKWAEEQLAIESSKDQSAEPKLTGCYLIDSLMKEIGIDSLLCKQDYLYLATIVCNKLYFPQSALMYDHVFKEYTEVNLSDQNKLTLFFEDIYKKRDNLYSAITNYCSRYKSKYDFLLGFSLPSFSIYERAGDAASEKNYKTVFVDDCIPNIMDDDCFHNLDDNEIKYLSKNKIIGVQGHSNSCFSDLFNVSASQIEINEAVQLTGEDLVCDDLWDTVEYSRFYDRHYHKSKYSIRYKKFHKKNWDYDIFYLYSDFIENIDYGLVTNILYETSTNNTSVFSSTFNYKKDNGQTRKYFGYRTIRVPHNLDVDDVLKILNFNIEYNITFNWYYVDILKILNDNNAEVIASAYSLVCYIAIVIRGLIYTKSDQLLNSYRAIEAFLNDSELTPVHKSVTKLMKMILNV